MDNLYKLGNKNLLTKHKTAFLCSRQTSYEELETIKEWTYTLSTENDCILCGNHSSAEQTVFRLLLEQKIPVILVLAEALRDSWDINIRIALEENRILIVTQCDNSVHNISKQSATDRNLLLLKLADSIVIGHCTRGGNIDRQTAGLANVTYLTPTTERTNPAHEGIASYRMPGINGYLFFDLQEYRGRKFLKITQSKPNTQGYYEKENIYIDHSELERFKAIIDQITETGKHTSHNKNDHSTD